MNEQNPGLEAILGLDSHATRAGQRKLAALLRRYDAVMLPSSTRFADLEDLPGRRFAAAGCGAELPEHVDDGGTERRQ